MKNEKWKNEKMKTNEWYYYINGFVYQYHHIYISKLENFQRRDKKTSKKVENFQKKKKI